MTHMLKKAAGRARELRRSRWFWAIVAGKVVETALVGYLGSRMI